MRTMRIGRIITNLPEFALGAMAFCLFALIFLEVVFRYFLKLPVGWSEEGARILFIWISFLGAAVCTKRRRHFNFEMIVERFPRGTRRILPIVIQIIIIGATVILIIQGFRFLKTASYERYTILDVSKVWSHISIPVCCSLILIYSLYQLLEDIGIISKTKDRNE